MSLGNAPGSQAQSFQMTLSVYQPWPLGGAHLGDLNTSIQEYQHSMSAFGGFDAASFELVDTLSVLEEWFEEGLGRGIVAFDNQLQVMWQGFVNQVTIRQAGFELSRGPLVNVVNQLLAVYSSIDTSTTPPTPGIRRRTAQTENTVSQDRYGVWPKVLSLAGVTDDNARQLRDSHLAEYSRPETRGDDAPGSGAPALGVQCLGYMHALNYPYNHKTGGEIDLSAKIRAILAADPNGWLSTDYGRIAPNSVPVSRWENDDKLALGLIKGLTAMGDADDNRHLFGIYEDRQAVYGPAPTDWTYERRLSDPRQIWRNRSGGEVAPWAVRPGHWVFYSDFLPGRIGDSVAMREDPRMLFIESLEFAAPNRLRVSGGKVDKISQKLARLGLAGSSV